MIRCTECNTLVHETEPQAETVAKAGLCYFCGRELWVALFGESAKEAS